MQIKKINNRLWKFIDEEIGEFSPSKFTINRLNSEITVVYFNNLKSKTYKISDVDIFDIPPATAFNTYNGDDFMAKLEELNCPCFQRDETTIIGGGAVESADNGLNTNDDPKVVELGGGLTKNTFITVYDKILGFLGNAGKGLFLMSNQPDYPTTFGSLEIGNGDGSGFLKRGFKFFSNKTIFKGDVNGGIDYDSDYSSTYTVRSLVDKGYADLKLDKVTTLGVERAYIINADGSQSTKATSEFFPTTGVPVTTNILSGNTDAAQAGAVSNVLYNFPIKKEALIVRGDNAPTNLEMQEFLLEMFIQGTYNAALKYSIYSIARNNSSNWFIRLYSQTASPGTIVKIAEFSTTVSPENGGKITFHTLSEFGGSGVSAKVAVNWSKVAVGSYYNMYDYNGYGLDLKVWDKQNSPLITLNEFPLPSTLVSKNLTTLETTNVKVNPLVYYNPRGNSEYIGNSTYSQTGLSAYMKVSSDTLVKMIDAPFFGTNFFGTVKIYTHPTLLTNPTLGTLVESFSLTSQDFNQNQLSLHRTILTNSIVILANTYIYVVAENTSGAYPSILRWTVDSVSSPLRDKILYKLSGTWNTGGSTFWSAPLALYSDIDSTQEILNLSTSKQDYFNPMLSIPSNIYAVVGTEMNLWYDALILSNDNGLLSPSSYRIDVVCAKGTVTERCFRINAVSGDVGSYPLTINVYDVNKKIVDSKTITLNIKAYVSPVSVKNILRVGDSLTAANTISVTTQSKFSTLGGNVPLFVGSKGTAPAKHEGIGGKRYLDFTITGSPFFIGGVIDVSAYRAANSISSIDIAVFHLGVNDCMGLVVKTTHEINQIIGYAKQLFTAFLNDNSNTKIIIMLPSTDGNTKGGYGINYQATAGKEAYQKSIFLLRKAIIDNFDNGIYDANVSVGIAGLVCDRYYGYELGTQAVSQRVTDLIPIHINAVHPAQSGYQQIGDNDFSHILSLIS